MATSMIDGFLEYVDLFKRDPAKTGTPDSEGPITGRESNDPRADWSEEFWRGWKSAGGDEKAFSTGQLKTPTAPAIPKLDNGMWAQQPNMGMAGLMALMPKQR